MSKLKQAILNAIREMTLLDDTFMTKFFEGEIKRAQFLLRILFNDDTIKVKESFGLSTKTESLSSTVRTSFTSTVKFRTKLHWVA